MERTETESFGMEWNGMESDSGNVKTVESDDENLNILEDWIGSTVTRSIQTKPNRPTP